MRPEEIVVGGVYRGEDGYTVRVLEITDYVRFSSNGVRDKFWGIDTFAEWAVERIDTEGEGEVGARPGAAPLCGFEIEGDDGPEEYRGMKSDLTFEEIRNIVFVGAVAAVLAALIVGAFAS